MSVEEETVLLSERLRWRKGPFMYSEHWIRTGFFFNAKAEKVFSRLWAEWCWAGRPWSLNSLVWTATQATQPRLTTLQFTGNLPWSGPQTWFTNTIQGMEWKMWFHKQLACTVQYSALSVVKNKTGRLKFFFCVHYSIPLHLPPLRFHCVGGWRDRTQDYCDFRIQIL